MWVFPDSLSLYAHSCRQDEGTVGEGYTVHEMCQLARSSLPAQRAFACRHLAALLARARPSLANAQAALFGNGRIPKPINVPGSEQAILFHTFKGSKVFCCLPLLTLIDQVLHILRNRHAE